MSSILRQSIRTYARHSRCASSKARMTHLLHTVNVPTSLWYTTLHTRSRHAQSQCAVKTLFLMVQGLCKILTNLFVRITHSDWQQAQRNKNLPMRLGEATLTVPEDEGSLSYLLLSTIQANIQHPRDEQYLNSKALDLCAKMLTVAADQQAQDIWIPFDPRPYIALLGGETEVISERAVSSYLRPAAYV